MKVGIIGAGTMGSGIAQAFAQTEGYEVCLCDINEELAANGKNKIAKGFEKRVAKGKMDQAAADAILAKITTGVKTICTDCDLVVEAALENMEIKKQTFKELQGGLHVRYQYIFPVHHRNRRGTGPSGNRHAFLQPGSGYEAGRSDRRPEYSGRDG